MADTEDIILRIALSGQDDVVARLGQIGEAGVGVMARLESAVTGGASVFAGLTAAITGVGAGLFYWANSASTAIDHMSNLAAQSGTTINEISGLTQTLSAAGANTEQLGSAFRRLAFTVTGQWTQIAQSVEKSANDAINSQLKLKDSALSVEDAQEKLYQAQLKRDQLTGAGPEDPAEKEAHDLANAYREVERAVNDLAKAEQAEREAKEAEEKRQRNDPEVIAAAVKAVAEGRKTFQQAGQDANLTFDKVIEGIISSAGTAATAIQNFNGNLSDLIGKAPSVKEVFFNLADFMKNSGDDALNAALAYRVLGRGVGQDVVEAMKQGSQALQENINRLEQLGLVLTDTDKKAAQDFIKSFHSLSGELSTTVQQIGAILAPIFTQGFDTFRKFIEENHRSIIDFAQDVANRVRPIILDFFNLISGRDIQTEWLQGFVDGLRRLGQFIKAEVFPVIEGFFNYITDSKSDPGSKAEVWQERFQKFGEFVASAFRMVSAAVSLFLSGLDKVAAVINKVFGTEFTGGDLLILGVIAKITNALGLMTKALETAYGAASKLFGLFRNAAFAAGAAELEAAAGGAGGAGGGTIRGLLGNAPGPSVGASLGAQAAGAAGGVVVSNVAKSAAVALAPGEFIKAAAAAISTGFAEAVGVALGTVGLVAVVGAGLTTLFLHAIDKAKEEQDKLRKGQVGELPQSFVPETGQLIPDSEEAKERFREEQRVRKLGYTTSREEQFQDLSPEMRRAREAYTREPTTTQVLGMPGEQRSAPSGREADLQALRDEWESSFIRRLQQEERRAKPITPGPGVPKEEATTKSPAESLLERMLQEGSATKISPREDERRSQAFDADRQQGQAADKQLQAADKQAQAADKQDKASDKQKLPGKDWTAADERMSGWTSEDQAAFESGGGPGADYYAKYGAQVADARGGGGTGDTEGLSEANSEAQQLSTSLDSAGTAATTLASSFTETAGALESVAARLASIQLPEPQHAAEGGLIRGPGGPKEDRVPAMLSAGEFVVTADGSNLVDAIHHFGRHLAAGGLIDNFQTALSASMPGASAFMPEIASRTLGVSTELHPVTIAFPGLPQISGLFGTRAAVQQLQRSAADRTLGSAGRMPSWYE